MEVGNSFGDDGEVGPSVDHACHQPAVDSIDDGNRDVGLVGGQFPSRYVVLDVVVAAQRVLGLGDIHDATGARAVGHCYRSLYLHD